MISIKKMCLVAALLYTHSTYANQINCPDVESVKKTVFNMVFNYDPVYLVTTDTFHLYNSTVTWTPLMTVYAMDNEDALRNANNLVSSLKASISPSINLNQPLGRFKCRYPTNDDDVFLVLVPGYDHIYAPRTKSTR